MKIFLSGAITGRKHYKREFEYYQFLLALQGHDVISPAEIVPFNMAYEDQMSMCFNLIDSCKAICLLPLWHTSQGSTREYHYAVAKRYKIFVISGNGNLTEMVKY
jgi:hypothetical protein